MGQHDQYVAAAAGGDDEGALGEILTAYVGEVHSVLRSDASS
jgi:hypothetical protein